MVTRVRVGEPKNTGSGASSDDQQIGQRDHSPESSSKRCADAPDIHSLGSHNSPSAKSTSGLSSLVDFLERQASGSSDAIPRRVELVTHPDDARGACSLIHLRSKLTLATALVLLGFGVFLIRNYFEGRPLQAFHTIVVIGLTALMGVLVSQVHLTRRKLRNLEWITFGLPVLFLFPYHYLCMLQQQDLANAPGILNDFKSISAFWLCLIVIYGMMVPNRWSRTAFMVAPMVAGPVAVGTIAVFLHPYIREHLAFRDISETYLVLCVGALCSIYCAATFASLQRELQQTRHFGQYRLLERLDRGGMGEVYKAEHQLLKRPCAIKLIRSDHAGDERALARFEREVRATARLTHWNTVDVYDYGRARDGSLYYVMEFLPGLNLREMLRIDCQLPPARCVHLLSQICGALHEAHASALIHRDINSGNIFVTQRGGVYDVAKLLDFGLVKTIENEDDTCLTQIGSISGTPRYMPPEQATSAHVADARSDIYSLGAVAYEMLSGHLPFDGNSPIQYMIAHARDPVRPISDWNQQVPGELNDVILKCLEKEPGRRYQTIASLLDALLNCKLSESWDQNLARDWWREHSPSIESESDEGDDSSFAYV